MMFPHREFPGDYIFRHVRAGKHEDCGSEKWDVYMRFTKGGKLVDKDFYLDYEGNIKKELLL